MRKILDSKILIHVVILFLMSLLSFSSYTKSAKFPILILALFLTCMVQIIHRLVQTLRQVLWKEKTKIMQRILLIALLVALCVRPISPLLARFNQIQSHHYWGADNLFYASMANSVAVNGDSDSYLAQSGSKIEYHAGPVFLLVVLERYLRVAPLDSIQILSLIFTLYIALSLRQVLISFTSPNVYTLIAPIAALNLPFIKFHEDIRDFVKIVLDNQGFIFNMILGSLFGVVILLAFINLSLSISLRSSVYVYVFTIICIYEIKPQYIPLFFMVIVIQILRNRIGFGLKLIYVFVSATMMFVVYLILSTQFSQETVKLGFRVASWEYFSSSAPRIIFWSGPFFGMNLIFLFLLFQYLFKKRDNHQTPIPIIKIGSFFVTLFLMLDLSVLLFTIEATSAYDVLPDLSSLEGNDEQLLHPLNLLILTLLIYYFQSLSNIGSFFIISLTFILFSLSLLALLEALHKSPRQNEYTNLNPIVGVSQVLNIREGIVLTNDFAYPGDNFRRNAHGDFLSVFSRNPFYFSGHSWFISSRGWSGRLSQNKRFYESPLSQWHVKFLTQSDIRFLLIGARCKSPIQADLNKFTEKLYQNSEYTLYEVNWKISQTRFPQVTANIGQTKIFGISDCLLPFAGG